MILLNVPEHIRAMLPAQDETGKISVKVDEINVVKKRMYFKFDDDVSIGLLFTRQSDTPYEVMEIFKDNRDWTIDIKQLNDNQFFICYEPDNYFKPDTVETEVESVSADCTQNKDDNKSRSRGSSVSAGCSINERKFGL
jgi:hypothetical protein